MKMFLGFFDAKGFLNEKDLDKQGEIADRLRSLGAEPRTNAGTNTGAAPLDEPTVDHENSRVLDRDRGLFDRVADAVGEGPDESGLYQLAAEGLADAAAETDLLDEAEQSATETVEELLADAGVTDVKVEFAPAPAGV